MVWMDQGRFSGRSSVVIAQSLLLVPYLVADAGLVVASKGATFAALMWGAGRRGVIVAFKKKKCACKRIPTSSQWFVAVFSISTCLPEVRILHLVAQV